MKFFFKTKNNKKLFFQDIKVHKMPIQHEIALQKPVLIPGDYNNDGAIDILDVILIVGLFLSVAYIS